MSLVHEIGPSTNQAVIRVPKGPLRPSPGLPRCSKGSRSPLPTNLTNSHRVLISPAFHKLQHRRLYHSETQMAWGDPRAMGAPFSTAKKQPFHLLPLLLPSPHRVAVDAKRYRSIFGSIHGHRTLTELDALPGLSFG